MADNYSLQLAPPIVAETVTPNSDDFIKSRIFTIRGVQVMLDRDLAELYGVPTKRLNEQVKRNASRFPATFRFALSIDEMEELVAKCDRFKTMKHSSVPMAAFTEHGVIMLASVLKSDIAIAASIKITNAFVAMRKALAPSPSRRLAQRRCGDELANFASRHLKTSVETDHCPPGSGKVL